MPVDEEVELVNSLLVLLVEVGLLEGNFLVYCLNVAQQEAQIVAGGDVVLLLVHVGEVLEYLAVEGIASSDIIRVVVKD